MNQQNAATRRAQVLADFQQALDDREALLRDPEGYIAPLVEQIRQAAAEGVIDVDDLREQLEWSDSALGWAIEELVTRELNQ